MNYNNNLASGGLNNNNQQPRSKNYLNYENVNYYNDKYDDYITTNFDKTDKQLLHPQQVFEAPINEQRTYLSHLEAQQQFQQPQHFQQQQQAQQQQAQPQYQQPQPVSVDNQENVPHYAASNYYVCPTCLELAISSCDCQYRDCKCPEGHSWYLLNHSKVIGISPNHK